MAHEKAEAVLAAARDVFLRHGFRRVTMGDIAEAARMSRPALYLVFPSKERVFVELIARSAAESLEEIREGSRGLKRPEDRLALAFEVWCVRPFELMRASPDAADLLECLHEFAAEATARADDDFEALLAEILESAVRGKKPSKFSPRQVARVLRASAYGFKRAARDAADLRRLIADMTGLVLPGLRSR